MSKTIFSQQLYCDACKHLIGPRQNRMHHPPDKDYHEKCYVRIEVTSGVAKITHCPDKIMVVLVDNDTQEEDSHV